MLIRTKKDASLLYRLTLYSIVPSGFARDTLPAFSEGVLDPLEPPQLSKDPRVDAHALLIQHDIHRRIDLVFEDKYLPAGFPRREFQHARI